MQEAGDASSSGPCNRAASGSSCGSEASLGELVLPRTPDGRHAALAVELLAAVQRSAVLEHMSRAVLQLSAAERRGQRQGPMQLGQPQPQEAEIASPLVTAAAAAEAACQHPANRLMFLVLYLLHMYSELDHEVQGKGRVSPALQLRPGPASQFLRAAHVVVQVAAAEEDARFAALRRVRAADPSYVCGPALLGDAGTGSGSAAAATTTAAAAAAMAAVQAPLLYGLQPEQLPLPVLVDAELTGERCCVSVAAGGPWHARYCAQAAAWVGHVRASAAPAPSPVLVHVRTRFTHFPIAGALHLLIHLRA